MKRYCTMFTLSSDPDTANAHLIKDVGMIPFIMYKYFNYESTYITYHQSDFNYLKSEVNGLKIKYIKKIFNNSLLNEIIFLIINSKKINVLNIYHLTINTIINSFIYKSINRKGILYIKADIKENKISRLIDNKNNKKLNLRNIIKEYIYKHCIDLLSVETKRAYFTLKEKSCYFKGKVLYIPNGIYIKKNYSLNKKENIVLTVGRLGSPEKATKILLEAFNKIKNSRDWKLILAGPIEEEFKGYIEKYFHEHPAMKEQVFFTGIIEDRDLLFEYYAKSKIFCLTSTNESFGIVLVEAAYFGNYLITTDVGAARDIIAATQYGSLVGINNVEELCNALQWRMSQWDNYKRDPEKLQSIVRENFSWIKICKNLDDKINELQNRNCQNRLYRQQRECA